MSEAHSRSAKRCDARVYDTAKPTRLQQAKQLKELGINTFTQIEILLAFLESAEEEIEDLRADLAALQAEKQKLATLAKAIQGAYREANASAEPGQEAFYRLGWLEVASRI